MSYSRLKQSIVNDIHAQAAQGRKVRTIAGYIGCSPTTVRYVLTHRPPTDAGTCNRCGCDLTPNRTRRIGAKGANYQFCLDCHRWVFTSANYAEASSEFPGIF